MIKIAGIKSNDKINFKEFVDFFYKVDWRNCVRLAIGRRRSTHIIRKMKPSGLTQLQCRRDLRIAVWFPSDEKLARNWGVDWVDSIDNSWIATCFKQCEQIRSMLSSWVGHLQDRVRVRVELSPLDGGRSYRLFKQTVRLYFEIVCHSFSDESLSKATRIHII